MKQMKAHRLLYQLNHLSQQWEIGLQDLEEKLSEGNVSIEHVEQWRVELEDEIPKRIKSPTEQDITRLGQITGADLGRIKKYHKALKVLL